MRLEQAIADVERLDDGAIITARRPWAAATEVEMVEPDERLGVPESVRAAGFEYFLEVHVARDVLTVFGAKPRTLEEKVRLVVHYAEHDAYPDWVYT